MGNADYRELYPITDKTYEAINGQTVAVDANNWLYKYLTVFSRYTDTDLYTTDTGEELLNLYCIPIGLKKFAEHNINPVFVFDGNVYSQKTDELDERKEKKQEAKRQKEQATDAIERAKYESRQQRITPQMLQTSFELLSLYNVPVVEANYDAERQAAYIAHSEDTVDSVISEDYDTPLFKSPNTVRNFTTSGSDIETILLEDIYSSLDFTHKQLLCTAFLIGTDYNDGVRGYGPKTAIKAVRDSYDPVDAVVDAGMDEQEVANLLHIYSFADCSDDYFVSEWAGLPEEEIKAYIDAYIPLSDRILDAVTETTQQVNQETLF